MKKLLLAFLFLNISGMQANVLSMGMGVMQISFSQVAEEERITRIVESVRALLAHTMAEQKAIINTALIYGSTKGAAERLLSEALLRLSPAERQKIIVVTWVGLDGVAIETEAVDHSLIGPKHMYAKSSSYEQFISESFQNLKMDRLSDTEFWVGLHRVNPGVPVHDQAQQLKKILDNFHVSKVGVSETSLDVLAEFEKVVPLSFFEVEMSLSRQFAVHENILDYCNKHNILLLAYSPLDRGIWTSKVDRVEDWLALGQQHPFLSQLEGWTNEEAVYKHYHERKKALDVALKHGVRLNELALAWVMVKGAIPIPDSTSPEHSTSNFKAMVLRSKLAQEDIAVLDSISFHGKRYK